MQAILDSEATPERIKKELRPAADLLAQLRERAMAARAKMEQQKTEAKAPPDTDPE